MLRAIDRDLWVAEQPLRYFGLSVGTRMTVIRLSNHELVIISPIQIDAAIRDSRNSEGIATQLNELGTVKHIIAPNLYHYLFAAQVKTLYPDAIFWAVPGLEVKRPELAIDQFIKADTSWNGLEHHFFDGFRTLGFNGFDSLNECVFFHVASRTLILTDAAFHFDESFPLLTQFAMRVVGGYKSLSPSILEKVASTEKEKVSASVQKILDWDFERVIMAHGSIIETNGKEQFKQGYESFLGAYAQRS